MRSRGESLSQASRLEHTTPRTVRIIVGKQLKRSTSRRYSATSGDTLRRDLTALGFEGYQPVYENNRLSPKHVKLRSGGCSSPTSNRLGQCRRSPVGQQFMNLQSEISVAYLLRSRQSDTNESTKRQKSVIHSLVSKIEAPFLDFT